MNPIVAQTEEIVKEVTKIQKSKRYSDSEMAKKFNCTRQTYQRTRTGKIDVGNTYFSGAIKFLELEAKGIGEQRKSVVNRKTAETDISIELDIDGTGRSEISTGIGIFDHLLSQVARHGKFDIKLAASGDDSHHLVEDVAICLGQAFGKALGEKRGIVRMANVMVPMDEALASVVVDISGRGYPVLNLSIGSNDMPGFSGDLVRHFLDSFAVEARLNLHAGIVCGSSDHHKAEALFKALGRALDAATRIDARIGGDLPTTKEFLEG